MGVGVCGFMGHGSRVTGRGSRGQLTGDPVRHSAADQQVYRGQHHHRALPIRPKLARVDKGPEISVNAMAQGNEAFAQAHRLHHHEQRCRHTIGQAEQTRLEDGGGDEEKARKEVEELANEDLRVRRVEG